MAICEQFIYTAAKIGTDEGYQIIAKSAGINEQLINRITPYLYPLGVKVSEFKESRSLLIFQNKVVYSIVKNIGIGYDGRRGTLYNHSFIIDKNEFEKLGNDSRIFNKFYIQDDKLRDTLPTITIEKSSIPTDFDKVTKLPIDTLKELLYKILKKNKIALVHTEDVEFVQNLFSVLPAKYRLIQFSTLVLEPDRQYDYDFIQIPHQIVPKISKKYSIVNPEQPSKQHMEPMIEESVNLLACIILSKDSKRLEKIHSDIDTLSTKFATVKRIQWTEIFDEDEFKKLVKDENYRMIKDKVIRLYSSKKLSQASPRVIITITKKIRKLVTKLLKKYSKSKLPKETQLENLLSIVKAQLDCLSYLERYSEKKISSSTQSEINKEKEKLIKLLSEYSPKEIEIPYTFSIQDYWKNTIEQAWKNWEAFALWILGKR